MFHIFLILPFPCIWLHPSAFMSTLIFPRYSILKFSYLKVMWGSPLSESLMSISPHFQWSHTWTSGVQIKVVPVHFPTCTCQFIENHAQATPSTAWIMFVVHEFSNTEQFILVCIHHIHSLSCSFMHSFWTANKTQLQEVNNHCNVDYL